MRNIVDLKSHYYRGLPEIGLIAQDLVGVQILSIELFSKLLLVVEYCVCGSHNASKEFCRWFR